MAEARGLRTAILMSRAVVVSQAHLLPRLHHVKRLVDADVLVLMNDHQLGPHWQRRTVIKAPQGAQYLTVPIKGGQRQHIQDVEVDIGQGWRLKVLKTLQHAYSRAQFFGEIQENLAADLHILDSFAIGGLRLYDLDRRLLFWVIALLGIEVEVVEQTSLGTFDQHKTDLMVALTEAVGGDVYHCGKEATERFYEMEKFEQAGIRVCPQEWACPEYPQRWGKFVSGLSVIDALFNVGVEGTREILGIGGSHAAA